MKLLIFLLIFVALLVGGVASHRHAHAFFNEIVQFAKNKITIAQVFGTRAQVSANHIVINEVLYDALEQQDIYKEEGKARAQWVELYNPTSSSFDLTGWSLEDNGGGDVAVKLSGVLAPGGFLLVIAVPASEFRKVWAAPSDTGFVEGDFVKIGNILDARGDRLILKDKNGRGVDKVSWGSDTSGFNLGCSNLCPTAPSGYSLEREPAGNDTDTALDFLAENAPTPGGK